MGCAKCGDKRHYLLEFHHNNPKEKELTISEHCRKTFNKLLPEIKKCSVLCSNCHREFHYLNNSTGITIEDYLKGE